MSILGFKENFLNTSHDEGSPEMLRRKKKIIRTCFFEKKAPSSPKAAPKNDDPGNFLQKRKGGQDLAGVPKRAPKVKCLKDIPELQNKAYEYEEQEQSCCLDNYVEQDSFMPLQAIENTVEEKRRNATNNGKQAAREKENVRHAEGRKAGGRSPQNNSRSPQNNSRSPRNNGRSPKNNGRSPHHVNPQQQNINDKEVEKLRAERAMLQTIIAEQKKIIGCYLEKSQKKGESCLLTERSGISEAGLPEKALREFTNISGYNSKSTNLFQRSDLISKSPEVRSDSGILEAEASVRRHLSFTEDDCSLFGRDREDGANTNRSGISMDLDTGRLLRNFENPKGFDAFQGYGVKGDSFSLLNDNGAGRPSAGARWDVTNTQFKPAAIIKEKINEIFSVLKVVFNSDQAELAQVYEAEMIDCSQEFSEEDLEKKLDFIAKSLSSLNDALRKMAGRDQLSRNQLKALGNQNKALSEENRGLRTFQEEAKAELEKQKQEKSALERKYLELRNWSEKELKSPRSKTEGPEARQTHPVPESAGTHRQDPNNFRSGINYYSTNRDQNKEIQFYNALRMVNNFYSQKLSLIFETLNNPERKEENGVELTNVEINSKFIDPSSNTFQDILNNLQIMEHIHNRVAFLVLESGSEVKKAEVVQELLKKMRLDDSFAIGSDEECELMLNKKSRRGRNKLFSQRQLSTILKLEDDEECESSDRFQVEPFVKLLNEKESQLEAIQKREAQYQNTIGSLNRELRRIKSLMKECPDSDIFGRLGHPEENLTADNSRPVIQFDHADGADKAVGRGREHRYFMNYSVDDFDFKLKQGND